MGIALTPSRLKAICPEAPASAILSLNSILARTGSVTHLRAAMLVAQLAASSKSSSGWRRRTGLVFRPRPSSVEAGSS
jgi:hypothetical protein